MEQLIQLTTDIPTYLTKHFIEDSEIILIYLKDAPMQNNQPNAIPFTNRPHNNKSKDDLDLTGTPLVVDLGGDESFGQVTSIKKPDNWTFEESTHYPLPINAARKILNSLINEKTERGQKPIYAICYGEDSPKTVIIGGQRLSSYLQMSVAIYVLGFFPDHHKYTKLEYMIKEHLANLPELKIDYLVTSEYNILNYDLTNSNLECTSHFESIVVKATWNTGVSKIPVNAKVTMNLQAIVGHSLSPLNFLWRQLCLLQNYLDTLSNSSLCNEPETEIAQEPLDEETINERIAELFRTISERNVSTASVDLTQLLQCSWLDKLWDILKHCENLASLRDSLIFFFESLADTEVHIPPIESNSTIGKIITGIIDGKVAIPTINFSNALQLLFELSVECLMNNYSRILSYYYSYAKRAIAGTWTNLCDDFAVENLSKRVSRVSISAKLSNKNLPQNAKKLSYIHQLHTATELVNLLNNSSNKLSSASADQFYEQISATYLGKSSGQNFTRQKQLCDFSFKLDKEDYRLVSELNPVCWSVKMVSKVEGTEVTTGFTVSEYEIIPRNIFDSYEINLEGGDVANVYFVTKMEKYVDLG